MYRRVYLYRYIDIRYRCICLYSITKTKRLGTDYVTRSVCLNFRSMGRRHSLSTVDLNLHVHQMILFSDTFYFLFHLPRPPPPPSDVGYYVETLDTFLFVFFPNSSFTKSGFTSRLSTPVGLPLRDLVSVGKLLRGKSVLTGSRSWVVT